MTKEKNDIVIFPMKASLLIVWLLVGLTQSLATTDDTGGEKHQRSQKNKGVFSF
jgi:hypothetical protein